MPLPDQTPRLPKWPFLLGDAAFLGGAWLIADGSSRPLATESIIAIVGCCVGAALLGAIPFLSDYARKQDEALDERQRSLETLARTISTSADQISIAASGFHEMTELAQKNFRHAEQLPQKLHEKIAEFQARMGQTADEEKEELEREVATLRSSESERLEAITDKIARAAADWAKVESAAQKQLLASKALLAQFDESFSRFGSRAGKPDDGAERKRASKKPVDSGEPAVASASSPPPAPLAESGSKIAKKEPAATARQEPPALVRPGKTREKRPEPESVEPLALEFSQTSPDDGAPSVAVSADGATRLLVTAYIGIGNRLFIRGDGPGLSWDKGVPMQFVSIGKWRWESAEATAPVKFKLYRNDETEFNGLTPAPLEPGRQMEMTASS